jgi:hypothetical protein
MGCLPRSDRQDDLLPLENLNRLSQTDYRSVSETGSVRVGADELPGVRTPVFRHKHWTFYNVHYTQDVPPFFLFGFSLPVVNQCV